MNTKEAEESLLEIDSNNLSDEFRKYPVIYNRHYTELCDVEMDHDLQKTELNSIKSQILINIKRDGEKRTVGEIEAMISLNPRVKEQEKRVLVARHTYLSYKGFIESLKAKKECMINIGAHQRFEVK